MKDKVTKRKIFISPSILTADFARLEQECKSLEKSGADWIHCDVMDGNFVSNLTFGMPVIKSIRKCVVLPLDVHLMINHPEKYITQFAEAGANLITIHAESTDVVSECLQLIRACGKKAGISIKPETPVKVLEQYRGLFDMVLIMSVEPGFGGQSFIESSVDKIRQVRQLFPDVLIEVDGGINSKTAKKVIDAGVDVIVAGSAILGAPDRKHAIDELRKC
ncbi:MAG: ribulose-phosphate 3-epimerase [Clostridiales bacterium]|nr:ribulose-phosphate 3-epimerase [Clostridiales bacterium]